MYVCIMLRPIITYPFEQVIDDKRTVGGVEMNVIHSEQSLIFNLDVDRVDSSIQQYISDNFAPATFDGLSDEQLSADNVFDLISPLSSRFCTDRAMRHQFANELQKYLDKKTQELADKKSKEELKAKYDKFIESLG